MFAAGGRATDAGPRYGQLPEASPQICDEAKHSVAGVDIVVVSLILWKIPKRRFRLLKVIL